MAANLSVHDFFDLCLLQQRAQSGGACDGIADRSHDRTNDREVMIVTIGWRILGVAVLGNFS
jgi:hypothetical protein